MKNIIASTVGISALLCVSAAALETSTTSPEFEIAPVTAYSIDGELIHDPLNIKWDPKGRNSRASVVESDGVPGGQAIQVLVRRKTNKPWDISMHAPFEKDIEKGERIDVYFWARTEKAPKGREGGIISVAVGRDVEPYDTIIAQDIVPSMEWKMYKVSGTADADFSAEKSYMGFNLGHLKQTVQFGPFFAATRGIEGAED